MKWLRLYNETPNDPKWRVVAVRSGQPVGNVLAVWMQMLSCASAAEERGTLEDWDDEIVAAMLGYTPCVVTVIRASMQGLVLDGMKLTGWDKRQFASDTSAERVKRHRNRAKKPDPGGSSGNGLDPEADAAKHQSDVTVTLQTENVTLHRTNVTSLPLRATDSQITEDSVASATAPPEAGAGDAPSLKSELFNRCLVWLIATTGRTEKSLRPLIGSWIKLHGEGAVLAAIVCAQRESAVSPVGFVEGILKAGSKRHGQANGSKHERLRHALGGAFADLVDPGPESPGGERRQLAIGYR